MATTYWVASTNVFNYFFDPPGVPEMKGKLECSLNGGQVNRFHAKNVHQTYILPARDLHAIIRQYYQLSPRVKTAFESTWKETFGATSSPPALFSESHMMSPRDDRLGIHMRGIF